MPAPEQREVRRWLSELAAEGRPWIQGTVLAGTLAGVATIVQMVLLAWVVHQSVVDRVPANELTTPLLGLLLTLVLRALFQGLQSHLAARCSEQVRRTARTRIHRHWRSAGPIALGQQSAGVSASSGHAGATGAPGTTRASWR